MLPALAAVALILCAAPAAADPGSAPLRVDGWPPTLAAADTGMEADGADALRMHAGPEDSDAADDWHAPWFTGNKLHQYLGIGSLVAAGLAAVSAPEDDEGGGGDGEDDGFHHVAGVTAAALGGAAVGTGLVFHWDDIRLRNGIGDPDNLHALLGLLGATAYVVAVSQAPAGGHAAAGIGGAVAMVTAIKITW
jgi:hypothetical protein